MVKKTAKYWGKSSDGGYIYYVGERLGYYTINELSGVYTKPSEGQYVGNVLKTIFKFTHLGRSGYTSIEDIYDLSKILPEETAMSYIVDNGETTGGYEWNELEENDQLQAGHDYTVILYYKTVGYDQDGYEVDLDSGKLTVTGDTDDGDVSLSRLTDTIPGETKKYDYTSIYIMFSIPAKTNQPPTITDQTSSFSAPPGMEMKFRIVAENATSYEWKVLDENGNTLSWSEVQQHATVSGLNASNLLLTANMEDTWLNGKKVYCNVSNQYGTTRSANAMIRIIPGEGTISGRVLPNGNGVLSDVTVQLNGGASGNTTTDGLGYYEFVEVLEGDYTITFSKDGYITHTETITVKNAQTTKKNVTLSKEVENVGSISLNETSLSLTSSNTYQLIATVLPEYATNKNVTWTSSNASVATVNSNGLVTAKSAGTATITATTQDGGYKATCQVTVTSQNVKVTGISLNETSLTLSTSNGSNASKSTYQLVATVTPNNATNKKVNWTSSNTSVATVDSAGRVTGKTYGTATITAATEDGGYTATCQVKVNFYDGVAGYTDGSHETISANMQTAIGWLADGGITRGYDGGAYFGSYLSTNRKDFVIFLWRFAGKPNAAPTKTFSDTPYGVNTDTYKAIAWATSAGIINGYSDGTFKPNDNVTRAQVAVMLWKYAGRPGATSPATSTFPDVKSGKEGLTDNMVRAINWCNTAGLVKGYSDGKFVPSGTCYRYQMAIILKRFNDNIVKG